MSPHWKLLHHLSFFAKTRNMNLFLITTISELKIDCHRKITDLYLLLLADFLTESKKKACGYQERDEAKRKAFLEQLKTLNSENVVYVDEAGMDNRDDYSYGWNKKGDRFYALKSGRRQERVNMITAYCNSQLMAPFTIEGACNRSVFEIWIETCLIPCPKYRTKNGNCST
jgi:hypothetical protein